MPDREKVIKWLEECQKPEYSCMNCPYYIVVDESAADEAGLEHCTDQLMRDALALLREHDDCENCAIAIEDRQPVVRCKDCKHYDPDTQSCNDGLDGIFLPDWFCANGKRRDDDA